MRYSNRLPAGVVAGIAALLTAPLALAHGPQVQITRNAATGKIETRQILDTAGSPASNSPLTRIYVLPLLPTGAEFYSRPNTTEILPGIPEYNSGPGIVFQYDTVLAGSNWDFSGSSILPNLQGTSFAWNAAAALLQWNGTSFVASGGEQLESFRGSTSAPTDSATSGSGDTHVAFASVTSQSANPHSSASHRLLGDGLSSTTPGDGNIYLAQFTLSSTAANVNPSDPFYFVLYRGVSEATAAEAANSFATAQGISLSQIQAIPEPGSVVLLGGVGMMLLGRRRRWI